MQVWLDWVFAQGHRVLEQRARGLANHLVPHLPAQGDILDIGCGTGHNALFLAQATGRHVSEVDVTNMKAVGPPPVLFDGVHLPFDNASFSCGLMLYVLHYVADPVALLQDVRRVVYQRLIVIQSTYWGKHGWGVLTCRDFIQGRGAFAFAHALGFVGGSKQALKPQLLLHQQKLTPLFEQAGWRKVVHEINGLSYWPVRRELMVLEPA